MSVLPQAEPHAVELLGHRVGNSPLTGLQATNVGGHRCLIVAELGINHNGSVERAEEMIRQAAAAGVDVVKLQRRDLQACYTPEAYADPNRVAHGLANYMPVLRETQLPDAAYPRLKALAEGLGLGFLVTPFDEPSVDFLEALGVQAYKLASCDLLNPFLHRKVAATGKPVIASTGMCDEPAMFEAVAGLKQLLPGRLVLMHTVSSYPTADKDCQLHSILRLKVNQQVPVGWSGHERGVAISVAAAALGADLIERHFTLDRTLPGPDQAASLEPDGLKKLVARVRAFEEAYGDPYAPKRMTRGEVAAQEILGKSLCFRRALPAGHVVALEDLEARSPGRGLKPTAAKDVVGKRLAEPATAGAPVAAKHLCRTVAA